MRSRQGMAKASLFGNRHLCAYCGCPSESEDHTPPLCLLQKPYPDNLFTIPACNRCNSGFSDDENLLSVILAHVSSQEDLIRERREGKIARAIDRDRRLKRYVDCNTDENGMFRADADTQKRISRILVKTVQGLYYHHYGRIVAGADVAILEIKHQREVTIDDLFGQYCDRDISWDNDLWPEVTPDAKALERAVLAWPYVLDVPEEKKPRWVNYQSGVFRYTFSKGSQGGLICVLDLHRTLGAAAHCPWPGKAGPAGGIRGK